MAIEISKNDLTLNPDGEIVASIDELKKIGVTPTIGTTNQTRTALFSPQLLREWAEAVEDTYGDHAAVVEVVFTPDAPMTARVRGCNTGISVCPMNTEKTEDGE